METTKISYGHIFGVFLLGGTLGVIAGILLAPKSGRELISGLKQRGEETLREGKEFYTDAKTRAENLLEDAKKKADDLRKEAERQVDEACRKAKNILSGAPGRKDKTPLSTESTGEIFLEA